MFQIIEVFAETPTLGKVFEFTGGDLATIAGTTANFVESFYPVLFIIFGLFLAFFLARAVIAFVRPTPPAQKVSDSEIDRFFDDFDLDDL